MERNFLFVFEKISWEGKKLLKEDFDMKSMKNIKPAYAVKLGTGVFMALSINDWYCKYCMRHPTCGVSTCGNFRPTDNGVCNQSPTGHHVWEHD